MSHEILSAALGGIDAVPVRVQIDSNPGLHSFSIVGLGDKAVQESIDRIEAAIKHSGFVPPRAKNKRFVINLAPADLKKEGPGYDLPIAIAYLQETKQIKPIPSDVMLIGELGLDGKIGHTNGILASTILAHEMGLREIIVPSCNAEEGALVEGVNVIGGDSLVSVVAHLGDTAPLPVTRRCHRVGTGDMSPSDMNLSPGDMVSPGDKGGDTRGAKSVSPGDSFAYIKGQETAKRALIVATAGGHNVLMSGMPGSGKTLLARSVAGLLPPMTLQETLEVAKIYSAAGLMKGSIANITRPFCAPHHTASPASVVGGGSTIRPGQVSLAHRGVLFMDELPEFARNVLESLRQPLEDGIVSISRASGSLTLPAKFMLIGAMNPCPCGNLGDTHSSCSCTPTAIYKYAKRISGPLLDRMDIQVFVSRESVSSDTVPMSQESLRAIRNQIRNTRLRQEVRLSPYGLVTNSEISHTHVDALCMASPSAAKLLQHFVNQKHESLRAYHKIQKVARTIADLDNEDLILDRHVAEAMALRINDRPLSGGR